MGSRAGIKKPTGQGGQKRYGVPPGMVGQIYPGVMALVNEEPMSDREVDRRVQLLIGASDNAKKAGALRMALLWIRKASELYIRHQGGTI